MPNPLNWSHTQLRSWNRTALAARAVFHSVRTKPSLSWTKRKRHTSTRSCAKVAEPASPVVHQVRSSKTSSRMTRSLKRSRGCWPMLNRDPRASEISQSTFEPRIVAFFCNWCTYLAADLAGTSRMKYAPNVRVVRLMCSGRVDPQFVLDAFAHGADGVFIGGCHPGDCHYQEGNYKTLKRYHLLQRVLRQMGIEDERFRLEWISAAEADRVRNVIKDMVEKVRALGPLQLTPKPEEIREEVTV